MINIHMRHDEDGYDITAHGMNYSIGGEYDNAVRDIELIFDSFGPMFDNVEEFAWGDNYDIDAEENEQLEPFFQSIKIAMLNIESRYDFVETFVSEKDIS